MEIGDETQQLREEVFEKCLATMANTVFRNGVIRREKMDKLYQEVEHLKKKNNGLEEKIRELKKLQMKGSTNDSTTDTSAPSVERNTNESNASAFQRWYWLVPKERDGMDEITFALLTPQEKIATGNIRFLPEGLLIKEDWINDYAISPMTRPDVTYSVQQMQKRGLYYFQG